MIRLQPVYPSPSDDREGDRQRQRHGGDGDPKAHIPSSSAE
jgi:hypothetical protein